MATVKTVNFQDMRDSIEIHYFGWSREEIDKHTKQSQSVYYGNIDDARFEITDDEGAVYYAVFKNFVEYDVAIKSKDYLLFKDQNRLLINVGGKIYRFLIQERKLDEIVDFCKTLSFEEKQKLLKLQDLGFDVDELEKPYLLCNDENSEKSVYFHSLSSSQHEVMIVVDREGIAALSWDNILWKHSFPDAASGDLELIKIKNNEVIAKYQDIWGSDPRLLSFDIQTGQYKDELFSSTKI